MELSWVGPLLLLTLRAHIRRTTPWLKWMASMLRRTNKTLPTRGGGGSPGWYHLRCPSYERSPPPRVSRFCFFHQRCYQPRVLTTRYMTGVSLSVALLFVFKSEGDYADITHRRCTGEEEGSMIVYGRYPLSYYTTVEVSLYVTLTTIHLDNLL